MEVITLIIALNDFTARNMHWFRIPLFIFSVQIVILIF